MQMTRLKLALFDVDGVLLDSLSPHLKICQDKNEEYGLGLKIPNAIEFKKMVRNGAQISPMKFFFRAVGFSEEAAEKANIQYQNIFMKAYAPAPFPDTYSMLKALHKNLQLGIVTSNVRQNVVDALGSSMNLFNPLCIYTKDNREFSKSQAIASAADALQVKPSETIYVGDQRADWEAAREAGVNFLGVAYGWGISEEDRDFPVARRQAEVDAYILSGQLRPQREQARLVNPLRAI